MKVQNRFHIPNQQWIHSGYHQAHGIFAGPDSPSAFEVSKALAHSTSIIAAYCRADALPEDIILDFPDRIRVEADDFQTGSTDLWQLRRKSKRQKILIALAHASSDGVFVGTVDNVMVLPELQNQGLGRRYGAPVAHLPVQFTHRECNVLYVAIFAE